MQHLLYLYRGNSSVNAIANYNIISPCGYNYLWAKIYTTSDVTAIIRVIRCKCGECGKRSSSSKGPTYVCNDHKYRSLVTLIDRSIDPCPDNNQSYGVWCHFNDPQCKYETRHNCRSVVVVVFRNCTSASSYHYNDRSRSH